MFCFEVTQQTHQDPSFQLFVGVFGVVGNTSGIIWFSRKLIQKNFHQLMLSLALCDLLYVLLNIFLFGIPSVFKHITITSYYNHMVSFTLENYIKFAQCCGHKLALVLSWCSLFFASLSTPPTPNLGNLLSRREQTKTNKIKRKQAEYIHYNKIYTLY